MREKILVTGAAGFIGRNLVRHLEQRDVDVIALDKDYDELENSQFLWVHFENLHGENLENIDTVIHCANRARIEPSWKDYRGYFHTNTVNTAEFYQRCQAAGVKRFVYISSSSAKHPNNPYAISKLSSEYMLTAMKNKHTMLTIIRPTTVYGADMPLGENGTAIGRFVDRYVKGEPLFVHGSGNQKRDMIHVDDFIEGMLLLLDNGVTGTHDVGTGANVSINDMASVFDTNTVYTFARQGQEYDTQADIGKLTKLGFKPKHDVLTWLSEQKQTDFKEFLC